MDDADIFVPSILPTPSISLLGVPTTHSMMELVTRLAFDMMVPCASTAFSLVNLHPLTANPSTQTSAVLLKKHVRMLARTPMVEDSGILIALIP
jgi:hypothetical protein